MIENNNQYAWKYLKYQKYHLYCLKIQYFYCLFYNQ